MTQEMITYLIVGIAFLAALRLMYKKLAGKKQRKNSCAAPAHDSCSRCPAECALRDLQYMKKEEGKVRSSQAQPDQRFLRL